MPITIDTHSGFCFGVTGAIRQAEEQLQQGSLYCLGDIVHNGQEVERLARMGLQTIDYDDFRQLRHTRVLLRAHGEPPSTYRTARDNGIEIIDASCPVVKHLQQRIRATYTEHPEAQIVLFGKPGHAEVIGLQGQTDNTAIVLENEEETGKLDFRRDIYLFSQTTKSVEQFRSLVRVIKQSMARVQSPAQFVWYDTICRNVANRVTYIRQFACANEVVIFVGGAKSSNARVLFSHCKEVNPRSFFFSDEGEITGQWIGSQALTKDTTIGVCGATSTPLWLMERCKQRLETLLQKTFSNSTF